MRNMLLERGEAVFLKKINIVKDKERLPILSIYYGTDPVLGALPAQEWSRLKRLKREREG